MPCRSPARPPMALAGSTSTTTASGLHLHGLFLSSVPGLGQAESDATRALPHLSLTPLNHNQIAHADRRRRLVLDGPTYCNADVDTSLVNDQIHKSSCI